MKRKETVCLYDEEDLAAGGCGHSDYDIRRDAGIIAFVAVVMVFNALIYAAYRVFEHLN
jgi:hypothetical protein